MAVPTFWQGLQAVRCRQELRSPMRTDVEKSLVTLLVITGVGAFPRCLGFSCMCAARIPVAPAVDVVPLCLWVVLR